MKKEDSWWMNSWRASETGEDSEEDILVVGRWVGGRTGGRVGRKVKKEERKSVDEMISAFFG